MGPAPTAPCTRDAPGTSPGEGAVASAGSAPARPVDRVGPSGAARSAWRGALVDWMLLLAPGTIWGASFLFIAEGLEALGPNGVTFTRIAIGFATLSAMPAARARVVASDRRAIAALGVLWLAFPLSMFPFAEQHVSSALTGMLNGATPLFVAAIASLHSGRLPSRPIGLGLLVGFAGGILIALPSLGEGGSDLFAVLLITAALVSYGISINLARPLQQRSGALPVVWRALAVAVVLTAPLGLPDVLNARWSLRPALAMLALGALGTGIANVLVAVAAGRLGATRAAATTFLIPAVALVLGVVVRGERVAPLSVVGGVVCLAGAWIIRRVSLQALARGAA